MMLEGIVSAPNAEQMPWAEDVALCAVRVGAFGYTPNDLRRFKAGMVSPIYIDARRFFFHPVERDVVMFCLGQTVKRLEQLRGAPYDVIASVPLGATPHASKVVDRLGKPEVLIRKEPKQYGLKKHIEGGDVNGKHVLLVEDLVTTFASSGEAIKKLRDEGALVDAVVSIVTYGFKESIQAAQAAGVHLCALTSVSDIVKAAMQEGQITDADLKVVRQWLDDPWKWTAENQHRIE